ncbi:MAG: hypothetical protein ACOCQD_01105 [archaeon]
MAIYKIELTRNIKVAKTQKAIVKVEDVSENRAINNLKKKMKEDQNIVNWSDEDVKIQPDRPRITYEVLEGSDEEENQEIPSDDVEEQEDEYITEE